MFGKTRDRITCYLLMLLAVILPWQGFAESEDAGGSASAEYPAQSFEMGTKVSMNGINVVDLHGTRTGTAVQNQNSHFKYSLKKLSSLSKGMIFT